MTRPRRQTLKTPIKPERKPSSRRRWPTSRGVINPRPQLDRCKLGEGEMGSVMKIAVLATVILAVTVGGAVAQRASTVEPVVLADGNAAVSKRFDNTSK